MGPLVHFTGVTDFTFNGLAGNDVLRINNQTGGVFAPAGGIDFNGGDDNDLLENLGGGGAGYAQSYYVGTTDPIGDPNLGAADEGTLITENGVDPTQTIHFTGLEPTNDTVTAGSLTVYGTNAANSISLNDGDTTGDGLLQVAVDAFEPMNFKNKTTLYIEAGDGNDEVTLDFTEVAVGLTNVQAKGQGDDDLLVIKEMAPVAVKLWGNAGDDIFSVNPFRTSDDFFSVTIDGGANEDVLSVSSPVGDQLTLDFNTHKFTYTNGDVQYAAGTVEQFVMGKNGSPSQPVDHNAPRLTVLDGADAVAQNSAGLTAAAGATSTIDVMSGSLKLRNVTSATVGAGQTAVLVESGASLDAGQVGDPGNNFFHGPGKFIVNQSVNDIPAYGNKWQGAFGTLDLTDPDTQFSDLTAAEVALLPGLEDKVDHQLDNNAVGLVRWLTDTLTATVNNLGINFAIGLSSPNDFVVVGPGTYDEQVVVDVFGLTLLGSTGTRGDVVISPTASGATGLLIDESFITVRDLSVKNVDGDGVVLDDGASRDHVTLQNLDISNNSGIGVTATGQLHDTLKILVSNIGSSGNDGVRLSNTTDTVLQDDTIQGHSATGQVGLRLTNVDNPTLDGNTFTDNFYDIRVTGSLTGSLGSDALDQNLFQRLDADGSVGVLVDPGVGGFTIQNNRFEANGETNHSFGIFLDHSGGVVIDHNEFDGLGAALRVLSAQNPASTVIDITRNHFTQGGHAPGNPQEGLGIVITGEDGGGANSPAKVQINGRNRDTTHNVFRGYSGPGFGAAGYAVTLRDFVTGQISTLDYDALCNDWHAGATPPQPDNPARIEDMIFDREDDAALGRVFAVSLQVSSVTLTNYSDHPATTASAVPAPASVGVTDLQIVPRETLADDSQIIDDGDPGFSASAGFFPYGGQGFQSDVHYAAGDNSGDTATWTFDNLTPGEFFEVSTTWSTDPNRATNAQYRVLDGLGNVLYTSTPVNQQVAPGDFHADGAAWHVLDNEVQVNDTGKLVVELLDNANGYVIADAVRLEHTRQFELVTVTFNMDVVAARANDINNYLLVADGPNDALDTVPQSGMHSFGAVQGDDVNLALSAAATTPFVGVIYDPTTRTATLALPRDLNMDHYRLLINADEATGLIAVTNNPAIDPFALDGDGDNCITGDDFALDFTVQRRLDFNYGASLEDPTMTPTAANYQPVVSTLVYGSPDDREGYGWQAALPQIGFDRTSPTDLRRDGNFNSVPSTFSVQVDPDLSDPNDGNGVGMYTVTLLLGDASYARNFMDVMAEGQNVLQNLSTAAGEWVSAQFDVMVTDGVLDLTFSTTTGDPFWVINGMEVVPTPGENAIVLHGPATVPAGSTVTFTSDPIPHKAPGSLITVKPSIGVVTSDADPNLQGYQVPVAADGTISFDVTATSNTTAQIIDDGDSGLQHHQRLDSLRRPRPAERRALHRRRLGQQDGLLDLQRPDSRRRLQGGGDLVGPEQPRQRLALYGERNQRRIADVRHQPKAGAGRLLRPGRFVG